jgi:DNA repair photolyase
VLTKSALVLRDLDVFSGSSARIGVTITTMDESLRRLWEPKGSPVGERLRVLEEARRAGLKTGIMFGPLLPFLSDSPESLDAMFQQASRLAVDAIWVDALNRRPRVWESVARLLTGHFTRLRPSYSRILFNRDARQKYLTQLRSRITAAAHRHNLSDKLQCCL